MVIGAVPLGKTGGVVTMGPVVGSTGTGTTVVLLLGRVTVELVKVGRTPGSVVFRAVVVRTVEVTMSVEVVDVVAVPGSEDVESVEVEVSVVLGTVLAPLLREESVVTEVLVGAMTVTVELPTLVAMEVLVEAVLLELAEEVKVVVVPPPVTVVVGLATVTVVLGVTVVVGATTVVEVVDWPLTPAKRAAPAARRIMAGETILMACRCKREWWLAVFD